MIFSEHKTIKSLTNNNVAFSYVKQSLFSSLGSIGFTKKFIDDLIEAVCNMEFDSFWAKHYDEITKVYKINYAKEFVPDFFSTYVVPHIKPTDRILDLGCGSGLLSSMLAKSNIKSNVWGIDITEAPEWAKFKTKNLNFSVVKEHGFKDFIKTHKPNSIVMTWVLHHMTEPEQASYFKSMYDDIDAGTNIIILEDTYSTTKTPKAGKTTHDLFMKMSPQDRQSTMSLLDWIVNKILWKRLTVPVPFTFKTLEYWSTFFKAVGFDVVETVYIGFPLPRDTESPQGLIVIKKD